MRLDTPALIVTLALGILAAPLATDAQQAGKVPRIGFLWTSSPLSVSSYREAFGQGLRELSYVEGGNLVIENRYAEGKRDRLPALAAELVRLGADIIVTQGTPAAAAAKQATGTVPIVMLGVGDPVGNGLVTNLARPGGNITGFSILGAELSGKRLQFLKEALPRLSRVAVLWDSGGDLGPRSTRTATEDAARSLGLQLQILAVRAPDDFDRAFAAATRDRADAIIILPSPVLNFHRQPLVDLALKSRLPAMYQGREFVEAGGLMAYGPSQPDLYRRAGTYVDKILKGARPGDLPVQQPTKFELVINRKTAQALGIVIPLSLLVLADAVIQ